MLFTGDKGSIFPQRTIKEMSVIFIRSLIIEIVGLKLW